MAAALYLFVTRILRNSPARSSRLNVRSVVTISASIIIGLIGILWTYKYAATAGMLGEEAKGKYESQSSGQYGLLLGGRTEMLGYLPAIYDSPMLGHGSWAKDPTYLIAERQALAIMGYTTAEDVSIDALQEGLIPTHSYIFGAWVDAGILGGFFWVWIFVLTARTLLRAYPGTALLLPLVSFVAFELLWDILFSPYGAEERIIFPFYVITLMTCSGMAARNKTRVATSKVKRRVRAALTPGAEPRSAHP